MIAEPHLYKNHRKYFKMEMRAILGLVGPSLILLGMMGIHWNCIQGPGDLLEPTNEGHSVTGRCFLQKYCFPFLYQPPELCHSNQSLELFVFVFSQVSHQYRRDLIRQTWANQTTFSPRKLRIAFLVGKSKSKENAFTNIFLDEVKQYQDLFVLDQEDTFHYLAVKGIYGLHIATHLCPKARYVMKTDDDMFINMFTLLDILSQLMRSYNFILGRTLIDSPVYREDRYGPVTMAAYPNDTWPPFCSGTGFVMPGNVSRALYELALKDTRKDVDMVCIDDVYISGLLAAKLHLKHFNIEKRYWLFEEVFYNRTDNEVRNNLFWQINDDHQKQTKAEKMRFHRETWGRLVRLRALTGPSELLKGIVL